MKINSELLINILVEKLVKFDEILTFHFLTNTSKIALVSLKNKAR